MIWVFVVAFWVAMLLTPVALVLAFMPTTRSCARCGTDTLGIRLRLLSPMRKIVQRRWCTACGWEGYVRCGPAPAPVRVAGVTPAAPYEADDDAAWRG